MNQDQIKLNFLEEAQDCFHTVESNLLNLSSEIAQPETLDLILREVHSVKGGSGMMGFHTLSDVAHRVEDFLKILRIHHHSTHIPLEVENLMLRAVDVMVTITDGYLGKQEIPSQWVEQTVTPIFEQLKEHLGELKDEDENLLLKQQDQASDGELLMFEEGVDSILDELEQQISDLPVEELSSALILTSEKILMFARMAELEAVIHLSESVQQKAVVCNEDSIFDLSQEALRVWRRSHGLVVRGNLDKLPWDMDSFSSLELDSEPLTLDFDDSELSLLTQALNETADLEVSLDNQDLSLEELSNLALEFEGLEDYQKENDQDYAIEDTFADISNFDIAEENLISLPQPQIVKTPPQTGKMVKVPVEQLSQFNSLFGKLILERNRLNLRLEQLKDFAQLMQKRMNQLESSNGQLRNWYDHASSEGWINQSDSLAFRPWGNQSLITNATLQDFDTLEMDRYSDLHLISQEQIETIVQLKEVSTDINFGINDLNQALQELNHTMQSLQKNATRIQMRPFADLVRSFPRFIRDLGMQFDKKVNLTIEGENTLLDRTFIEALNAPLTHLLRNAFDHGIEDAQTRRALGKPAHGNITLSAFNRGTQIVITIKDDGGGVSLKKISQRLLTMGISEAEIAMMTPSQMIDYIFEPGFSTASQVTELSGRGVGMDIVRSNIQELRGEIHAHSIPNQGTTFTLTLPFNLSILRVMIVEAQQMVFAIPVNSVKEMIASPSLSNDQKLAVIDLNWQNQTIPMVNIEQVFVFNRPNKPFEMSSNPVIDKPTALIVGEDNNYGAIRLDRYWGEQEVTIRPIETHLPLPPGFISSMILGDGRVLPVIDPMVIVKEAQAQISNSDYDRILITEYTKPFQPERHNTILIVDDSINVRRYLASTLEKAGYQVEQAKDGQEAVDKLLAGISVQGIICDIEMPRLDGYGVLEEIKGKSTFKFLPIIMLTSRSNEKHKKLAFNLGADAYFSKPYNEEELLNTIHQLINVNYI